MDSRSGGLYDSAIAAQLCGLERTGLANVLAEVMGINIEKSKRPAADGLVSAPASVTKRWLMPRVMSITYTR